MASRFVFVGIRFLGDDFLQAGMDGKIRKPWISARSKFFETHDGDVAICGYLDVPPCTLGLLW